MTTDIKPRISRKCRCGETTRILAETIKVSRLHVMAVYKCVNCYRIAKKVYRKKELES